MTQRKEWLKKHQENLEWLIVFLISIGIYFASTPFGFITILSIDVLKSLIEAEATILGLYGIIVAYMLTSYDNRLDRLEQQKFDLKIKHEDNDIKEIEGRIGKIKERKRKTVWGVLLASGSLIFSFMLSITTLGIVSMDVDSIEYSTKMDIAFRISPVASMFLFLGIFAISLVLLRIGKEPEY